MPNSTGQATSAASPIDDLSRLVIAEQIRALKARYLRLLDTQQWDALGAVFLDDAHFTLATFGEPLVFHNTKDWMSFLSPLLDGGTTVHQVHQGEIEVADVDTASARWAMSDYVVPAAGSGRQSFYGHGHYTEQYRRVDGGWKIASLELSRLMLNTAAGSGSPQPDFSPQLDS
jgi:3-phenylpropionate/cinnamic acid dioxygenase small subunit